MDGPTLANNQSNQQSQQTSNFLRTKLFQLEKHALKRFTHNGAAVVVGVGPGSGCFMRTRDGTKYMGTIFHLLHADTSVHAPVCVFLAITTVLELCCCGDNW